MRSGWGRAASWVLLFWDRFSVSKLLSQIQRSTLWLLQGLSQRPSFGGFGIRELFVWMAMFQSASGQKAGCNVIEGVPAAAAVVFQSSSSQKAGCNANVCYNTAGCPKFQSSSSQKAGCNPTTTTLAANIYLFQSAGLIVIQPEGRMQRSLRQDYRGECLCFNPHPARRPDATRRPRQ